jgi:hypothetical protein
VGSRPSFMSFSPFTGLRQFKLSQARFQENAATRNLAFAGFQRKQISRFAQNDNGAELAGNLIPLYGLMFDRDCQE